jgi:superfamily II DNA or RNA helicase
MRHTPTAARALTLRPYQADAVIHLNDAACIESPTGSGKTLTATPAAAILRENGATKIVIPVPMEHIKSGFDTAVIATARKG